MSSKYFRSKPVPKKAESKRLKEAYENQLERGTYEKVNTFEEALKGLPYLIDSLGMLNGTKTGRMPVNPMRNNATAIQRQATNALIQGQVAHEMMQEELSRIAEEFKALGKLDLGIKGCVKGDEVLLDINDTGLRHIIGYDRARGEDLSVTGYYQFNPETAKYDPVWTKQHIERTAKQLTEGECDQMLLYHQMRSEQEHPSWTKSLREHVLELAGDAWSRQDFSKLSSEAREKVMSAMKSYALDSYKTFMDEYLKSWIAVPENRYLNHISEEIRDLLTKPTMPFMMPRDHEFDLPEYGSNIDEMLRLKSYERFGFACLHQPIQGVVRLTAEPPEELLKELKEDKEDDR